MKRKYLVGTSHGIPVRKGDIVEIENMENNGPIISVNGNINHEATKGGYCTSSAIEDSGWKLIEEERNWDGVEFKVVNTDSHYRIEKGKKSRYKLIYIENGNEYDMYSQKEIDDKFSLKIWKEIKQTKNKEMKATTFAIKGKPSLLTAITEELLEMGYVLIDGQMPRENDICIKTTKNSAEGTTKEEFSKIIAMPCSSINTKNKQFSLPAQYEEALAFCKKQLSDAYWTKEEGLKIGDFIYFLKQFDGKNIGFIAEIRNISADTHSTKGWISYNNGGFRWCDGKSNGYTLNKDFRKATEQEIKAHKEKELLEEAVKRGFVEGAKFTSATGSRGFTVKLPLYVLDGENIYGQGAGCIYSANTKKWATIVPQETILTLGSNNIRVHITKEKVWADGKEGYFNMSHLKQYIFETQQGKSLGAYNIKLDNEKYRIYRIGCREENNMFSLEELQQVVKEYDKLQ